jgi:hypothetical protein
MFTNIRLSHSLSGWMRSMRVVGRTLIKILLPKDPYEEDW